MTFLFSKWFAYLSRRERLLLLVGLGLLGGVLFHVFLFSPFLNHMETLSALTDRKAQEVRDMREMVQDYGVLQQRLQILDQRIASAGVGDGRVALTAYLQGLAEDTGVAGYLTSIQAQPFAPIVHTYREETAELRLEHLTMTQVIQLVAAIEEAPRLLRIKQLLFKRHYDQPEELMTTLVVGTYEKT